MKPTANELKCVEFSRKIREETYHRRIENNQTQKGFFSGIYKSIFSGKSNSLKKHEAELFDMYSIDDEVPENKTFMDLWNYKGLRDWGADYLCYYGYTNEEQMSCLKYWFFILYGKNENDFELLCIKINNKIAESARSFYLDHPNGHIINSSIAMLLPEEIDAVYGNYVA